MEPEGFWQLFNWLDVVLSIGLLTAFLVGLGAGFYRQVAITASLLIGLVLASQLTQPLARTEFWQPIHAKLGTSGSEATAYAAIILATLLTGLLSVLVFRSYFGRTLRFVDSILGGATGLAIGALLFGLTILGVFHWPDSWLHGPIRESYLGSRLAEGARGVSQIFPEDYRERVAASLGDRLADLAGSEESNSAEPNVAPVSAKER